MSGPVHSHTEAYPNAFMYYKPKPYSDTLSAVIRVLRPIGVVLAAFVCAIVFGVGVPTLWIWLASQLEPTSGGSGQGVGMLAATLVIVGPLASYIVLVVLAGRFRFSQPGSSPEPQRMAWTRSRAEIRERARTTTTFEQVVLLAIMIVGLGFEVWFFGFAHCSTTVCFG